MSKFSLLPFTFIFISFHFLKHVLCDVCIYNDVCKPHHGGSWVFDRQLKKHTNKDLGLLGICCEPRVICFVLFCFYLNWINKSCTAEVSLGHTDSWMQVKYKYFSPSPLVSAGLCVCTVHPFHLSTEILFIQSWTRILDWKSCWQWIQGRYKFTELILLFMFLKLHEIFPYFHEGHHVSPCSH